MLLPRVAEKIDVGVCWEWTATVEGTGYGRVWFDGKNEYAHRHVYEQLVGPIPPGMQLDHLCRNRSCCNPDHLEIVTHAENVRRGVSANGTKTHCVRGHSFTRENTRHTTRGRRVCRACEVR